MAPFDNNCTPGRSRAGAPRRRPWIQGRAAGLNPHVHASATLPRQCHACASQRAARRSAPSPLAWIPAGAGGSPGHGGATLVVRQCQVSACQCHVSARQRVPRVTLNASVGQRVGVDFDMRRRLRRLTRACGSALTATGVDPSARVSGSASPNRRGAPSRERADASPDEPPIHSSR